MDPSTLLLFVTVATSIWAFSDKNLKYKLMLSPYAVVHHKKWYQVISHAFVHVDWMHLIFNMLALWSFGGVVLEYFMSFTDRPNTHFYIMYFMAILISSTPDLIKRRDDLGYLTLGASGAVSAVIFAAIFFDPWSMIYVFFIPCPGILFGIIYLIYSSYMGKKGGGHINHDAHFYGSVFGFLYPLLIEPQSYHIFITRLFNPSL